MIEKIGKQRPRSFPFLLKSFSSRRAVSISPARTARVSEDLAARRQAKHREHVGLDNFAAAKADQLIER